MDDVVERARQEEQRRADELAELFAVLGHPSASAASIHEGYARIAALTGLSGRGGLPRWRN